MSYRLEKSTGDLVIDGFEQGIAPSPHKGIANMQNVNISTEVGEVMSSYNRVSQTPTTGSGTLTQVTSSTVSFTTTPSVGSWIKILTDSGTGLSGNYYYAGGGQLARTYVTQATLSSLSVNYLVASVGGGGGGGGQVNTGSAAITATAYTITVGAGGATQSNGNNSSFGSISTSTGGKGTITTAGGNGGSGTTGGSAAGNGGGGGGGSGNGGNSDGSSHAGSGSAGTSSSISGSATSYGGGGGGGAGIGYSAGSGGSGGGGNGNGASGNGTNGTANTGGGGGGTIGNTNTGGSGGSGIVIISAPQGLITATGGSKTTSGGNDIWTFTSSGTWTVSAISPILSDISSGTATYSIYSMGSPIQSASEIYRASDSTIQYRYYILDSLGQVWIHDTFSLTGLTTPVWFMSEVVSQTFTTVSGLAVLDGWLTITFDVTTYWKSTSTLDISFVAATSMVTPTFHSTLVGHGQSSGVMYWTDGNQIGSIIPDSGFDNGVNVQSYILWTGSSTTGTISEIISGTSPYINPNPVKVPVVFFTNYYGTLPPTLSANTIYYVEILIETKNPTFNVYDYPNNRLTVNLTANPSSGAVSGTLTVAWAGTSGTYNSTFFSGETREVTFTNGSTGVTWTPGLSTNEGGPGITLGAPLAVSGGIGPQYFNTFDPFVSGTYVLSNNRLVLPPYETAQCLAELGSQVLIGCSGNIIYPWDQVSTTYGTLIFLPENSASNMVTVENVTYIFVGTKGNIYVTNGSSASATITIPDYCAGIPGTPSSYYEPYFTWGGAMFLRGRLYFSVLDQTSTKTGNCGGIWSFIPSQNSFINQDIGTALRLENQSSYGTYNGVCPVLLPSFNQLAVSPQYWSAWYSSITSPSYGIDFTGTTTGTSSIIETDMIPTGTMLKKETFNQIEYKVSTPLQSGESITIQYRKNITDSYTSLNSVQTTTDLLSGYYTMTFQNTQWLQLLITLNPLNSSSSSMCRLKEIRLR